MGDELIAHMTERVVIPPPEQIELVERKRPEEPPGTGFLPFLAGDDLVPPMAIAGAGYKIHASGLTHDERGYPKIDPKTQERMLSRMLGKIQDNRAEIIEYEETELQDAEVILVTYGSSARSATRALRMAREQGMKVGMLRLITPWPFPGEKIEEIKEAELIVPEVNAGQMAREIERWARKPVHRVNRLGGAPIHPQEILKKIKEVS
jgi:2-oxoglutarate ferredoxin oxidoreductase subunit alpha